MGFQVFLHIQKINGIEGFVDGSVTSLVVDVEFDATVKSTVDIKFLSSYFDGFRDLTTKSILCLDVGEIDNKEKN